MIARTPTGWTLPSLALAALLIQVAGADVQQALRYEREAVLGGELWRLLSGHLVHLGWPHMLWNGAALIVIALLFGRDLSERVWCAVAFFCAMGVALGMLVLRPDVDAYVGLSGVLHGLFAAGAMADAQTHPRTATAMVVLLAAKLGWEQLAGPLPGTAAAVGGVVLVDAHLYGAVLGIAAAAVLRLATRQNLPRQTAP